MLRRLALLLLLIYCAAAAHGALRLGERQSFGADLITPGRAGTVMRAVATSWGYLAVWNGDVIRATRITHDGTIVDPATLIIGGGFLIGPLATDGNDVLVPYGEYVNRRPVYQVVRVSPEGEVVHLLTIPDLAAIFWTGRSYVAFIGACSPREALQFDSNGKVLSSVALRLPSRTCAELAPFVYRDPAGVLRLIYQDALASSTGDYTVWRIALTDSSGDPIAGAEPERLNVAVNTEFRSVAATADRVYLLAPGLVQPLDHAGRAASPPVPIDSAAAEMTISGNEAIVVSMEARTLDAWRVTPNGQRYRMGRGPVSSLPKGSGRFSPRRRAARRCSGSTPTSWRGGLRC